jgi:hypothetical protein
MNDTSKVITFIFIFCFVFIGINVLDVALGFALLPWHVVHDQVDSANKIVDKTYDADNAIYNYEWFLQKEQDIKATEKNIETTKQQIEQFKKDNGNMSTWDYQTKDSYRQLQTVYIGQQNYLNQQISDYNARSSMANRNIFKNGLPAKIDQKVWV